MLYREAGQFRTSYAEDQRIFPIRQDRIAIALVIAVFYVLTPIVASPYWLQAILIPTLIFSLAAIGLNILTGYAGQVSLGTGGFMAVGAFAAFKDRLFRGDWVTYAKRPFRGVEQLAVRPADTPALAGDDGAGVGH